MGTKSPQRWTVAIQPAKGAKLRKITKIIGLNGGGFSVIAPYHKARSGFLFKLLVNVPTIGPRWVNINECIGFTAEDRVKLTYHIDGFAQFSGENPGRITSGRDPKTGEPKGLGLFTHPLSRPIVSGPSVGLTVWGIEDFELARRGGGFIVFGPDDFYYRGSTPRDTNSWHLSIFAFAIGAVPLLRFEGEQAVMEFLLNPIWGRVPGSVVKLKTIHLKAERIYLGLCVERFPVMFPSKSGWFIHGPGNYTPYQAGYSLEAVYPRDALRVQGRASLDRMTPSSPEGDSDSRSGD